MGNFDSMVVANVSNLEDGISSAVKQAKCLEYYCQSGGMLVIMALPQFYKETPIIYENCELASINYNSHFVVSGDNKKLENIKEFLKQKDISYFSLPVSQAFHSSLIDFAKENYTNYLKEKTNQCPQTSFFLCESSDVLSKIPTDYLWNTIRRPMDFRKSIQKLEKQKNYIYRYSIEGHEGRLQIL